MRGEGDVPNMATVFRLPDDDPDYLELLQLNDNGPFPPPIFTQNQNPEFYRNFSDINDYYDMSSWNCRELSGKKAQYVVAVSCGEGEHKRSSSGFIVELDGTKYILTSTYITHGSLVKNLKIEILFRGGKKADGKVLFFDELHGIVVVRGDLDNHRGAPLFPGLAILDDEVVSLGRSFKFGLMATCGKINARNHNLVSDDLMSCTCVISESGIGGPLFDTSSGLIIGMNVFIQEKSSLFMPSAILTSCLEQLLVFGRVVRPWLGMKTRCMWEMKLDELELIYESFPDTSYGIIVDEVTSGSPGEKAGVCTGDFIISCNGYCVWSPLQLSSSLLSMGKLYSKQQGKRRDMATELEIQRPSSRTEFGVSIKFEATPHGFNKWPDLPIDVSDNCKTILFNSMLYGNGLTTTSESTSTLQQDDDPNTKDIWIPEKLQSKFTRRFQEDKKPLGTSSVEKPSDGLRGMYCSSNLKTRNSSSSIFHDIEPTKSSSLPPVTDVIENVESTGIVSEISVVQMPGKPVCSTSISDTLFGNGLTTTSESTSNLQQGDDPKKDDIWNPEKLQSKFTCWYQADKKPLGTASVSSLLSLIIGGEKDKNDGLNGVLAAQVPPHEIQVWQKTCNAGSSICSINGSVPKASVLTCEDLEQSMLLEIGGDHSRTLSLEREQVLQPFVFSGLP